MPPAGGCHFWTAPRKTPSAARDEMDHNVPSHLQFTIKAFKVSRLPVQLVQRYWNQRSTKLIAAATLASGGALLWAAGSLHAKWRTPNLASVNPLLDTAFYRKLKALLAICVPRFRSRESGLLGVIAFLSFLQAYLAVKTAENMGKSAKALVGGNLVQFTSGVLRTAAVSLPATVTSSSLQYFTSVLGLHFRRRLTEHCQTQYLNNITFAKAANPHSRVDHFDSRISADVERFTQAASKLYQSAAMTTAGLAVFTNKLSKTVGFEGPMYLSFYYILTGLVLRSLAPQFTHYFRKQGQAECDLRCTHARLAAHAPEVVYFGDLEREKSLADGLFEKIYTNSMKIFRVQSILTMIDTWMASHGSMITGFAVVAMPAFSSSIPQDFSSPAAVALRTHDYVTNSRVVASLTESITRVVLTYRQSKSLVSATNRIFQLVDILRILHLGSENAEQPISSGRSIRLENVTIVAPDGDVLVESLTVSVSPGSGLVVCGASGAGKTALFNVLAGVWPLHSGRVLKPDGLDVIYVPQQPYLPVLCLRELLVYPHSQADLDQAGITDARLEPFLRMVGLKYLLEREKDGWDMSHEWSQVLSAGEQQRIAIARVLYHQPRFVILDDSVSALTPEFVRHVYSNLSALNITPITATSHRNVAWTYHVNGLFLHGDRTEFRPLANGDFVQEAPEPQAAPQLAAA